MKLYEFEFEVLLDDDEQVAGGTTSDAQTALEEAEHYEAMYREEGAITLRFYKKLELTRDEMKALALLPPNGQGNGPRE